jgi:K+-transporting ATPase c subunit
MVPASPDYSTTEMFVWTIVLGMVYGLLIEVITSAIFKAKAQG